MIVWGGTFKIRKFLYLHTDYLHNLLLYEAYVVTQLVINDLNSEFQNHIFRGRHVQEKWMAPGPDRIHRDFVTLLLGSRKSKCLVHFQPFLLLVGLWADACMRALVNKHTQIIHRSPLGKWNDSALLWLTGHLSLFLWTFDALARNSGKVAGRTELKDTHKVLKPVFFEGGLIQLSSHRTICITLSSFWANQAKIMNSFGYVTKM